MANQTPNQEHIGTSPLALKIEVRATDDNLKITTLESFDGIRDPHDNMSYYENLIEVHGQPNPIKCRLFISTLKKKNIRT